MYHLDRTAPGTAALVRLNLLKRLDSSPAAFRSTVARLTQVARAALDAARVGRVLSPSRGVAAGTTDDLDPLQLTMVELVASAAPPALDLEALTSALERDLQRLGSMARRRPSGVQDRKLDALARLLDDLTGEKVLLFTEYRDTAESLGRALSARRRVGRVDGGGAWLGGRRAGRRAVLERFAPHANGRPPPPDREHVDVLIATDVLSEGLNLQDARHVVSYDLPWNPVRLLQRIGRVDRLGSAHDQVEVHLFVPGSGLEPLLGLVRRLRTKLGDISAVVGADHADDLLDSLARRPKYVKAGRDGGADGAVPNPFVPTPSDPMETLRTLWLAERRSATRARAAVNGEAVTPGAHPRQTATAGCVAVPASHPAASLRWVLLVKGAGDPELLEMGASGAVRRAGPAASAALRFALTSSNDPDPGPGPGDAAPAPLDAVLEHLRTRTAMAAGPPPLRAQTPAARLARALRRGLGRSGAAATPGQIGRVDSLLRQLALPLSPAEESAVRALLHSEAPDLSALLDQAECALGTRRRSPPPAAARNGDPTFRTLSDGPAAAGTRRAFHPPRRTPRPRLTIPRECHYLFPSIPA